MLRCKRTPLVSLVFAVLVIIASSEVFAQTYYVSPSGSDSNPGTITHPWKTFKYAQGQLSAGDTLYMRDGIYLEGSAVSITRKGTAADPITIQSYPGEQATISGALSYFMTAPNSEWVLVDPAINLYRSARQFTTTSDRGAWLVNDDISIIQYNDSANMDSTTYTQNGMDPFYNGPGIMYRGNYIYIRLEPNPTDQTDVWGNPITPVPSTYNPNQIPIAVWTHNTLIYLTGAEYIHFKDLTFAHADYIIDTGGTKVNYIELDHCTIKYGSYGVLVRNATPFCHDWYVHDCDFTNGMPDWIGWTDVKVSSNPKEAYPEFQSSALSEGAMVNFLIEKNVFHDIFDGMTIPSGSMNVSVLRNLFEYSKDDALNIRKDVNNVEVAHNIFWQVATGISCLSGTGEATGPVYIHHNIIDNSHLLRLGRAVCADSRWGSIRWAVLDPFGSHDDSDKNAWWRVYNNTIITRQNEIYFDAAGPSTVWGNSQKYVYNNIFFVRDKRRIFTNDLFSDGSHYDGNVFYQDDMDTDYPAFYNFGDGGSYRYLADFRAANPDSDWEVHGLQTDPCFDFAQIDNPVYDANIWERYRPDDSQVFTPGASYTGLNWPDIQNVWYRGAIPPEGANLNGTGLVDFADFAIFARHWLETDCFPPLYCEGADINKSDGLDMQDLYEFSSSWLDSD